MKTDLRILLLEDLPADAELIEHEIRKSAIAFRIRRVETRRDFLNSLSEFCPDIILSDYHLPEFNGMEALALAREHAPAIPFIMVTGSLSEEIAVECMKQGAWDYIIKDRLIRLGPAIRAALEKKHLRDAMAETEVDHAKSRDFNLNLLEVSPALIWRAAPGGRFDYFNRNWLDFTGRTIEQETGSGWSEGVHPDDAGELGKDFREAFSLHIPFEREFRLLRHDGVFRWIQTFGRPFRDEQGQFAGFIGYCFDKTDRYETEEVLRKLSRAVEQSSSAMVITDTEGCIEYANRSYSLLTGHALEDIIGRNPRVPDGGAELPDLFGNAWEKLLNEGEWQGELQCKKKSGELYWEHATFSPIKNSEDVVTHYLVEKEDITSRKLAERELRKSRAELLTKHEELKHLFEEVELIKKEWESTMDCIGDVVIVTDKQGTIIRCNKATRKLTGGEFHTILGNDWRAHLSGLGIDLPEDISSGIETLQKQSGRCFFCKSYPFVGDTTSASSGSVITIHDFTDRKKVTDELEKAYTELKATQTKVVQQEKMASIGQLAAGVAHEINNPMGFISSNLGTLGKYLERMTEYVRFLSETGEASREAAPLPGLTEKRKALKIDHIMQDGKDLISESLEGAERVRTIVRNLKSFSRVDESQYKPADINECIESTINIVWNELKYKANLARELGDIPMIRCYPQELNQVFMNLLVNAAQAIEKQGDITVRTWHDADSVFAAVTDTGCGIPEAARNRIFEPFFTTKEVGKGTGLGLSITYDIVKKHNGDIIVESEPGKGSTFTVRLPIVQGALNG